MDVGGRRGTVRPAHGAGGALLAVLSAVLEEEPGEAAVTDALLAAIDVAAELEQLVEGLADLLQAATAAHSTIETDLLQMLGEPEPGTPDEVRAGAATARR